MTIDDALVVQDLQVDVSDATGLDQRAHTSVTLVAPRDPGASAVVAFGFPGGGYNRRYFDLDVDLEGPGGPSEARWHAARGWWYVACDHLGIGDSSRPDPEHLTLEVLAAANDATVREVCARIGEGTVSDALPPVDVRTRLGFGQSMGGCLTIVAQARHKTFDGIGVLGFSAVHTVLPRPGGIETGQPDVARGMEDSSIEETATAIEEDVFRYGFHWEDVSDEIVELDLGGYPMRDDSAPPWGRDATAPPVAGTMLSPGLVAAEAAAIDAPVLIATGERDVVPEPRAEPLAYGSDDVCVFVVPRMAHMHNFAGTRLPLWQRAHQWGDRVADARGGH